jgi:hypothetical protein
MNTSGFEGYTGISWGDGLLIHDILVCALIVLLTLFAYTFHTCYPLFEKMIRGLISLKERPNLFDAPTRKSVFFNVFMRFQTLFLGAVIFFMIFCRMTGIQEQSVRQALILLNVFLIMLFLLYLLKHFLYYIYSRVFTSQGKYHLWDTTYHTLFYFCGILFYLPVLWLFLDRERFVGALIFAGVIFVLFRITAIYAKIRIYFDKNNGFLYLILYLCAQEIVPLLFLYESLTYLHNVVESSFLWQ